MSIAVYEQGVRLGTARTNNELIILAARAIGRSETVGLVGTLKGDTWIAHMDMSVGQFFGLLSTLAP